MSWETIELRGMPLARVSRAELVEHVLAEAQRGRGGWVVTANVDHLQRYVTEPAIAAMCQKADCIVADGMPLLWACALRGTPLPDRVAGSDLVWLLAEGAARRGLSIYLLGGNPGAAEAASGTLRQRWPGLEIAGFSSPVISTPPTHAQLEEIARVLAAREPALAYVALGAPKQELLIEALRERFPRTWWIGVGISLSFIAGEVSRAPVWMQRIGLEWLHRLSQEPGRLSSRYLVRNLPFTLGLLGRSALQRLTG
jgi:N-acetylglucosaminyldiphosphoundecaprenol N-acetyl-beta-D-mannosaminyltransferase